MVRQRAGGVGFYNPFEHSALLNPVFEPTWLKFKTTFSSILFFSFLFHTLGLTSPSHRSQVPDVCTVWVFSVSISLKRASHLSPVTQQHKSVNRTSTSVTAKWGENVAESRSIWQEAPSACTDTIRQWCQQPQYS
jgi:hypothetical protein